MAAFAAVLVVVTVLIVQRYYFHEKLSDYTVVNDGVVVTKEFNVKSSTAHQNSSVKGTIFVWGDKGMAERMRIVASFEIDPKDFGGMTVYIPKKWYISNILSSHPKNQKTSLQPYASEGDKSLGDEWRNEVIVGVDPLGTPSGGGTGTILIDLVSDRKAISPSETFNIMISIGSDTQKGVRSIGVDWIKIPITVNAES
ncbi:hypothetical protein [Bacillus sp. FJAT-28004]|uniref:hypothetical protein n=1 Tax=Bacillus sp. FJAT-28004 TaxID=1679165 RepID=UPI0006B43506|nr:hypothetical protein [Bacillus sp. FJAT-28004]